MSENNREENKLLGSIDAQRRFEQAKAERVRERDESTQETLKDGSIRGRSVEYKTITFPDGVTKRIKNVVRYWMSAEAVANSRYRGY